MELLLESGVVRILSIDLDCDEASVTDTQVRARWTVTVKIHDAHAAREMALAADRVGLGPQAEATHRAR